jgi:hypothetical protein
MNETKGDQIQVVPPAPESEVELREALAFIERWEREQKDLWFWEKLGRLPFMLLDKITPRFIQQKIGQAIDEVGRYVQSGGQYLISEKAVLGKLGAESLDEARRLPLQVMNEAAEGFAQSRSAMAAVQGATTGFGGLFTLAVDIPAMLGISLKVIQEIALSYGFDPKRQEERIFVIKCLQFASSDFVGKKAILEQLSNYGKPGSYDQMASQLQGWREVVAVYRDNFGWKKLFQLVPVAGMLFGAVINRGMLQDTSEAAAILYRKRRVLERLAAFECRQSSGETNGIAKEPERN